MAAPPGMSPQQMAAFQQHMQQQLAAEASKRGMTPEEFIKMQREQVNAEAAKHGMTPEQYVNNMRMRALQQRAAAQQQAQAQGQGQPAQGQPQAQGQQQQQQQQGQPQGQPQQPPQQQTVQQQVPVNPNNPPDPKAVAVAKWLRSQNLKSRTCILDGQRKDMFKGIAPCC
jgi:translocation protein SEC62